MTTLSNQEVEQEIIAITAQLLLESGEEQKREVQLQDSIQRHLGIDSLGRAELFRRIEKKFQMTLPDKLLAEAETLNDIAQFLASDHPTAIVTPRAHIITSHGEHAAVNPAHGQSLTDILFLYGEKSPNKAHIFFQNEEGGEEIISYGQLLKNSLQVAQSLRVRGLKTGETVAIMQPTNPGFFYTFFGTLLAGGVPVPIYPPFRMHMLEAYAKTESHILRNAEVRILVTFKQAEKLSHLLQSFVPSLKHVVTATELLQPDVLTSPYHAKSDNYAFIQYTSGSTADPKGVLLTHANLLANIRAYGKAIKVTPDDVAVSWLPLYHDMGLIGMWLGSLYFGVPLILLTPFSFLNHPERWLWAIHYHRGTVSGAPNFAYELCVRKLDESVLEGLDLSSWRMTANGAEKVYPRTLEQFATKFAPYGFKRSALLPVYGLAESTVALTIPSLEREFRIDKINRKAFEEKRAAIPSTDKNALEFVGCGKPLPDHEIRIVDEDNRELAERYVGNLQFRGPSSMQGYYNNPKATQAIFHEGWFDSGDLAYIADDELFITGRRKDLIIKAGRNLYPAEIEELVGNVAGIRQGCVAAFGMSHENRATEQLIIVAETREKNSANRQLLVDQINETITNALDMVPDAVILVAPHIVPKTSSGKLQRAACKQLYLAGKLGKRQTPAWLQIAKLGLRSLWQKSVYGFTTLLKFFYTLYAGAMLLLTFIPLFLILLPLKREAAAKACKNWAKLFLKLAFCPVTVINSEKLYASSPMIFAPNHTSYIDSIVMLALLPLNTRFVGKKELFSNPIIGAMMRKLDYLSVDRIDLARGVEDTKHIESILQKGFSILIFPEGTFGYSLGLRPFRLGAFKIAVETQVPICPIALKGTRSILRDEAKLMTPHAITITVCEPVRPQGSEWQAVTQLRQQVRSEIAKFCGEPTLDFIVAQTVAPKRVHS